MGLASKRRGGSGSSSGAPGVGGTNSRSSKGSSSGRVKEKGYKGDDAREDGKVSRNSGHGRSRLGRRVGSTSPAPESRRRRNIDPTKLARGMSSRLVGARVSQQLTILTPDEIERDLRHMEAYGNACTAYAQQFFIFHNRNLVQSGHFGPVSTPGLTNSDHYLTNGATVDGYGYQAYQGGYDGQYGGGSMLQRQEASPRSGKVQMRDGRVVPGSQFAMPVRIDPEEEKRVAMLRKRIAASESQREVLETEYISLRAHYVNESQRLLRTRDTVDGQLKMLQELIRKRGDVVALKRVRCAVARDILSCLERRTQLLETQDSMNHSLTPVKEDNGKAAQDPPQSMDGVVLTDKEVVDKSKINEKELADILDVWNSIEDQLRDAEHACVNITTPKVSDNPSKTQGSSNSRPSKGVKEATTMNGGKKKPRRGSDESSEKESSGKKNKDASDKEGEDDCVVPWESQIMPRTPYGVPVLLSYMSSVPDMAAGYACGGMFGSKKHTMCWLESNIPKSFEKMGSEREEMLRLREESQFLTQELEKERETNKELQRQIISGRKRSDEMCAMMTMLRSETEAVLNRHNVLLYTPEARTAAEALHSQALEEREQRGEVYAEEELDHVADEGGVGEEYLVKGHRSPHAMSPEEAGEVHEGHELDDQGSLSGSDGKGSSGIDAHRHDGLDRSSGQQLQEDDNDNDGDDEGGIDEDEEEEGEILEDDRRKPPDEVYFGGEIGNHNDVGPDWGRKDGIGRTGGKRAFGERDSEDGGDELSAPSSPHGSFGAGKRRRRV